MKMRKVVLDVEDRRSCERQLNSMIHRSSDRMPRLLKDDSITLNNEYKDRKFSQEGRAEDASHS
jgi:hypothetical protein